MSTLFPFNLAELRVLETDPPPMSAQDQFDAHGHDMHPQALEQLVGYQEGAARRVRRTSAADIISRVIPGF